MVCLDVVDEVKLRPGMGGKSGFVWVRLPLVTADNASELQERRRETFTEHAGFEWPQLEMDVKEGGG